MTSLRERWAQRRVDKLDRPQGLIASRVLLDRWTLERGGDEEVALEAAEFCRQCLNEALLVPEEIHPDAWAAFQLDVYLGQVNNGGHGQYAYNLGLSHLALQGLEHGLQSAGAAEVHGFVCRFIALMENAEIREATLLSGGFDPIPPEIKDLDRTFFASPAPGRMLAQAGAWLRSSHHVEGLPTSELRVRLTAIAEANPLRIARLAAREALVRSSQPRPSIGVRIARLRRAAQRRLAPAADRTLSEYEIIDRGDAEVTKLRPLLDEARGRGDAAEARRLLRRYRHVLGSFPSGTSHKERFAYQLYVAGERFADRDLLGEAVEEYGLVVSSSSQAGLGSARVFTHLGQSLVALGELNGDPALFDSAVERLREALDLRGARIGPSSLDAIEHVEIARAHLGAAKLSYDARRVDAAIEELERAEAAHEGGAPGLSWADGRRSLARALLLRGLHEDHARARAAAADALAFYEAKAGEPWINPAWAADARLLASS